MLSLVKSHLQLVQLQQFNNNKNGTTQLIHGRSRPVGAVMNDYSMPDHVKVQSLQDTCKLAKHFFLQCRLISRQPTGLFPFILTITLQQKFENAKQVCFLLLYWTSLPFGSNKGPACFHRLSQTIQRCMVHRVFEGRQYT